MSAAETKQLLVLSFTYQHCVHSKTRA